MTYTSPTAESKQHCISVANEKVRLCEKLQKKKVT